jgi:hypothetical protein
MGRKSATLD